MKGFTTNRLTAQSLAYIGARLGDLVDLVQILKEKRSAESDKLRAEICELRDNILSMVEEMESPLGPLLYEREILEAAPLLRKILTSDWISRLEEDEE